MRSEFLLACAQNQDGSAKSQGIVPNGAENHTRPALNAAEAFANAVIGFVVSWAATFFVLGYSPAGSAAVTAMFFCLSFARSYALRIIFGRLA